MQQTRVSVGSVTTAAAKCKMRSILNPDHYRIIVSYRYRDNFDLSYRLSIGNSIWHIVTALVINTFVVFSRKKTPLTTSDVSQLAVRWPCSTGDSVDNTWLVAAFTACTKARCRLIIAISAYPTCIRQLPPPRKGGFRQNIATPFGMEKLEWCGYQTVKKFRPHVYSF